MGNSDSFMEEVAEEVRREQLFRTLRRYRVPLAVGLAVLLIGGAAAEWWRLSSRAAARDAGAALVTAAAATPAEARQAAFAPLAEAGGGSALVARFHLAGAALDAGETDAAIAALRAIAEDGAVDATYRDLARLQMVMAGDALDLGERGAILTALISGGGPFQGLALEQRAVLHLGAGDLEAAMADLATILRDPVSAAGLRRRAEELNAALGGPVIEPVAVQGG